MTSMQIGSSIGIALLAGIAGTAADAFHGPRVPATELPQEAMVHGYNVASLAAACFLIAAALAVLLTIGPNKPRA
jgi:hypothetical protein